MPDENRTETSRLDALSTAESLFGDTVAAPSGELGEEQEVSTEADQNQQGSDVAEEEQAVVAETARPEELKVVVSIKDGRATIGVQRPSSDPHIELFDDADPIRAGAGSLGGGRKGESQVGGRAQVPRLRATHSLDRTSATAQPGIDASINRRGRRGPTGARDAEAVLTTHTVAVQGPF